MKKENPYAPKWRERWRPEGCYIKGMLKCGKQCAVEAIGGCSPPPPPNAMPEPNFRCTHISELVLGSHDYEDEYMAYCHARNAWRDKKSKGPEPKWSDFCHDPYACKTVYHYVDVEAFKTGGRSRHVLGYESYELWNPTDFEELLLSDGGFVRAIHESAKIEFAESCINAIARNIRRVFVAEYQPKLRHRLYAMVQSCKENDTSALLREWAENLPPWDFHWKLCLESIERSATLIARCMIANYSDPDNEADWAMRIAAHTAPDPDLQQRLDRIQAEHEAWKGHAYRIVKKDRRPPDVIEAERRAAAERAAETAAAANITPLVKRVAKQRPPT